MELSRLSAKFEENVLDATNAWSHHVHRQRRSSRASTTHLEQARVGPPSRAARAGCSAWTSRRMSRS
jgi:Zn-dependent oligopeptidase